MQIPCLCSVKDAGEAVTDGYLNTYNDFIIENVIINSKVSGFGSSKATVWGKISSSLDSLPVVQANLYIDETKNRDQRFYDLQGQYPGAVRGKAGVHIQHHRQTRQS
jgi:hypothetical protein